jgi:8-oxo-dGTP pyrophosphatase MutT (NUDIX family)
MVFVGPGNNVVVVLHVGGYKASDIKLVLHRKPRTCKTWSHVGSILPNEELVDADVRELIEETSLTLTPDDLSMLSNNPVRVSLLEGRHQLVYVFSAHVPAPYVTANFCTLAKVVQAVTAQSTIHPYGAYVVLEPIDIDGLLLTPT